MYASTRRAGAHGCSSQRVAMEGCVVSSATGARAAPHAFRFIRSGVSAVSARAWGAQRVPLACLTAVAGGTEQFVRWRDCAAASSAST